MLMPIQLPDQLVISTDAGIQIRDAAEVPKPGFFGVHMVAAPLNLRSGVDGDAQQREAMLLDGSRHGYDISLELASTEAGDHFCRVWKRREGRRRGVNSGQLRRTHKKPRIRELLFQAKGEFSWGAQAIFPVLR